jgi:hypothetical protein
MRHAVAVLAVLAVAGCGGSDKAETKTTTAATPPSTPKATSDTPLVRCLASQRFITVKPGAGGVLIVTAPASHDRAVVRTYDSLSDALRAGHRKDLDLDQIAGHQTIEYNEGGTGQIKIAVETCR